MKIILDESLGLASLESEIVRIKPLKLQKTDHLEGFLKRADHKPLISKKIAVAKRKQEEEISYFIDEFPPGSRMIYFYDSFIQPEDELNKLTNWLMNERCLIPVPAPKNRALLYMLVEEVQSLTDPTKQEVEKWVDRIIRSVSTAIVTPRPNVFANRGVLHTYRQPKKELYKRAVWNKKKFVVEETGKLFDVWKSIADKKEGTELWVVKKGIQDSLPSDRELTISSYHLPVNIPFIHTALIHTTNRWSESYD